MVPKLSPAFIRKQKAAARRVRAARRAAKKVAAAKRAEKKLEAKSIRPTRKVEKRRIRRVLRWFKTHKGSMAKFRRWLKKRSAKGGRRTSTKRLLRFMVRANKRHMRKRVAIRRLRGRLTRDWKQSRVANKYQSRAWAKANLNKSYKKFEHKKTASTCNWICKMRARYAENKKNHRPTHGKGKLIRTLLKNLQAKIKSTTAKVNSIKARMTKLAIKGKKPSKRLSAALRRAEENRRKAVEELAASGASV